MWDAEGAVHFGFVSRCTKINVNAQSNLDMSRGLTVRHDKQTHTSTPDARFLAVISLWTSGQSTLESFTCPSDCHSLGPLKQHLKNHWSQNNNNNVEITLCEWLLMKDPCFYNYKNGIFNSCQGETYASKRQEIRVKSNDTSMEYNSYN
jgi:hypothetical protein